MLLDFSKSRSGLQVTPPAPTAPEKPDSSAPREFVMPLEGEGLEADAGPSGSRPPIRDASGVPHSTGRHEASIPFRIVPATFLLLTTILTGVAAGSTRVNPDRITGPNSPTIVVPGGRGASGSGERPGGHVPAARVVAPPHQPDEPGRDAGESYRLDPDHPHVIALDTEYDGTHTLTIQAAMRISPDTIAIQLYRSEAIPDLPHDFDLTRYLPNDRYRDHFTNVVLRPTRPITPDLSPARILRDLLAVPDLEPIPRHQGRAFLHNLQESHPDVPPNVEWDRRARRWRVPALNITFVAHFFTADFYRICGREFLESLAQPEAGRGEITVRARRLLTFVERGRYHDRTDPLLEYARREDGRLFEVRVTYRDTMLPFGHGSLDDHSQTFLGLSKSDVITAEDKRDMSRVFRERPHDAYGYALVDSLNTLLVYEQMQERDRQIYMDFDFPEEQIPPLRPTLGGRVSEFLARETERTVAAGSSLLSSMRALKELMSRGGQDLFRQNPEVSRYGVQTTETHGGLLYSRTPTRFWQEAKGMLRDVDMSGCYNRAITRMGVYWGRPIILEPGSRTISLREAVEFVMANADPDAWVIRATGDITAAPNALIPSTEEALTSRNYQTRRQRSTRRPARRGFTLDMLSERSMLKGTGKSKLYSAVIESGIVAHSTWLMIQAMPPEHRRQYEDLTADAIIIYPRRLVAHDGAGFDGLVERHRGEDLPWSADMDLERLEMVQTDRIDAAYVSLRMPIDRAAERIGELRRDAQRIHGKKSGADLAFKQQANTMYGVLACAHLPTNNFVAANQITAMARAVAFGMMQALNGFQVITDGCTYRLDQIPACTFAECLERCPDYPIRRSEAGSGIPFLDPATIPTEDRAFTDWFRDHLKRFFGVSGPAYDALFATHDLEHKLTRGTDSVAFDALATDGCGNYAKAMADAQRGWRVEDFAARSYGKGSKPPLKDWIIQSYPTDNLTEPAPITEDTKLLKYKEAGQKAVAALGSGLGAVVYPLGMESRKVGNYKCLKASAFVFKTPEQRKAIVNQIERFQDRTGCGLEALALRRSYAARRQGSMVDIAEEVYGLIRDGGTDLTGRLNLNRRNSGPLGAVARSRPGELERRKRAALEELFRMIDVGNIDPATLPTGYVVTAEDQVRIPAED